MIMRKTRIIMTGFPTSGDKEAFRLYSDHFTGIDIKIIRSSDQTKIRMGVKRNGICGNDGKQRVNERL